MTDTWVCRPRSLNLSAQDEMVAIDHAPLLRMNGFDISIDEDAEMGHRVKLLSHPVSKDIKFGVDGQFSAVILRSHHLTNQVVLQILKSLSVWPKQVPLVRS